MNRETIYHFMGIKGAGMSALALLLHGEGYQVQGSDVAKYFFTQQGLEESGITMMEFSADNIQPGLTIIAGNAFNDDHLELVRARELGLEIYRYHDFIGQMVGKYTSIAVTGSHGKTSTTGLLAHTLGQLAPTSYLIGDGTGLGSQAAEYFALEACEYRRHFLAYEPDYSIITNVDFDHPDYYSSIQDVFQAMEAFAQQTRKAIVACGEDRFLRKLQAPVPVYYYGFSRDNDIVAENIQRTSQGSAFNLIFQGDLQGRFQIPTYGEHNILNALAVLGVLLLEGFESQDMARHMASFPGVKRRFSVRDLDGLTLIDDYAHHPSEIKATIDAAQQKYPDRDIVAIFQPHTYSRTLALLQEFAEALSQADKVFLVDIFHSAREEDGDITIEDLARRVGDDIEIVSQDHLSPLMAFTDQVLIFMGAGDIDRLSQQFEKAYSQSNLSQF